MSARIHQPIPNSEIIAAYRQRHPDAALKYGAWTGPCPACGGEDRFWIPESEARPWGCRRCEPGRNKPEAVRNILEALGLWGRKTKPEPVNHSPESALARMETERKRRQEEQKRIRYARGRWDRAVPAGDTPAARYLKQVRRVWPPETAIPRAVRWLDGALLSNTAPPSAAGAILWAFTLVDGTVQAVGMEALTRNGEHTRPRWRRTFGLLKNAMFRVGGPATVLHVCEGPVDALAARWLGDASAMATGGKGGLAKLRPDHVAACKTVHIHVDADSAGRRAAQQTYKRLTRAEVDVTGTFYRTSGPTDAADWLHQVIRHHGDTPAAWSTVTFPLIPQSQECP